MLIVLAKSQSLLFDAPVQVSGSVRKDGTLVAPHVRIQKIAAKRAPAPQHHAAQPQQATPDLFGDAPAPAAAKRSKLDAWVAKHGGDAAVARTLSTLTEGQQQTLLAEMGKLTGQTAAEVAKRFEGLAAKEPEKGETGDLFAQREPEKAPEPAKPATYAGMTVEEMATIASRHGHSYEDALKKISARPGAWINAVIGWKEAEKTEKSVADKVKRDAAWKPNEAQQKVLGMVEQSSRYSLDNDAPMFPHNAASTRALIQRGLLSRVEFDDGVEYRVNRTTPPAAPTPAPAARGPWGVPAGISKAERRAINAKVVDLVTDGRVDLDLMRQYSGNGGCGDSLNEFYTDPEVASSMWRVVERLAGPTGTALEPSCATGVFLHTAPAGYRVTGVEMDPISQACAVALHGGRHEVMPPMSLERFAHSDGGRQFKVVIGNPPYGPRGGLAKDDKRDLKTAEAYFIDTALDKAEAGGIVALVVPAGIMNSKNGRAFRERMLRKAEFLGAQRMPNTAFEASHTDVTADIIWLRKRPDDVAGALMTVNKKTLQELGVWDPEFLAGTYFEGRGTDNLFGKAGKAMRAFGEIYTVEGSMAGVPERIAEFEPHPVGKTPSVQDIVAALGDDEAAVKRAMGGAMVRPYADGKKGDTKTVDGVTYVLQGDPLRWHRVDEMMEHEAVADARPLAARVEAVLAGKPDDSLAADIQTYIARHGIPVKNERVVQAADQDKALHRLIGAVDRDGRLSDAVTGHQAKRIEGSVETAAATLAAESEAGTFTVAELAERSGKSRLGVSELLHAGTAYAYAGGGRWTTMDQYLTGDLWAKLDAVRAGLKEADLDAGVREKYELQARRLEEAIAPKSLEDVEVTLASGWVPASAIEAWLNAKRDALRAQNPSSEWYQKMGDARIEYDGGLYSVKAPAISDGILEKYLNRTGLREDDRPTVDRWNEEFKAWLLTSDLRDSVEDLYNRKFRGFVERQWSREPIDVPGLDTAGGTRTPNDYHWDSLRWALHNGKGIIADDVGLGKTLRGLMLARLAKMNGQAQKPTFVVPKTVLANWVAEASMWFPGSRVLVIGETYSRDKEGNLKSKPDTPAERNRKYHDLAQNDYDFVFVSRDAYNELDLDPETKNQYLGEDFWVQRGDKLGNAGDKRVKKVREQFEQAQADREFGKRTDAIYFNQLPIDMLIMDEGHAYKNLYAARARFGMQPKFLGGQGQSNRAFDTGFKAKWLREKNGGKGVFMLTATPTKNSPLEIYSMLSYVAPEEFERLGIRNSEDFLDRFCEFRTDNVLTTGQGIEQAMVTSGFKNLDELRQIMAKYIMRRTAQDVGLKIPTPADEMHLVDMSPAQQRVYSDLREQLAEAGKKDAVGDAHIFSIMDKMAKAALDLELVDKDAHAGAESPKYQACAEEVAKRAKEGGQVVFCEAVDSHEKIAAALVKAGVPRDRIGIMNAQVASSSAARQNLSDKFNSGAIDVIIGNKVMEEGVNLQKRTSDIHHLDTPWDPATLQQRNGRGVRQGNKRESVRLHTYLARGSFDGSRYQSMRAKKDWQELLWNGGDRVENLAREGVISREDLMVAMAANPDEAREKLQNDKAAAMERHAAEQRVEASEQFVRFKSLQRSFRGLKNQDTAAGRRLRAQIEKAKTTLAANPYFKAKSALDSNDEVLIHPGTGDVVQRDQGIEVSEPDGTTSRWVVTGIEPIGQYVSMRPYADTTGHKGVKVPLMKLAEGTKEFKFDKEAEAAEVGKKLAESAKAAIEGLNDYDAAMKMPAAVIDANHDIIQRQLKEHFKAYTLKNMPHGDIPLIERGTGKMVSVASYDAKGKLDTHDFVLPSTANRQAVEQAWIDARRGARLATESTPARTRTRHVAQTRYIRKYEGARYDAQHRNPWTDILNKWDGHTGYGTAGPTVKAARARLEAEQYERIRRAKSADEVVEALPALAKLPASYVSDKRDGVATYPAKALAMAWAKLRQVGSLGNPRSVHEPQHQYAGGYRSSKHDSFAYGGGGSRDDSLHAALVRMAVASGHHDLAAAMAESGIRHKIPKYNKDHQAIGELMDSARLKASGPTRVRAARAALASAEAGGYAGEMRPSTGYYSPRETHGTYLQRSIDDDVKSEAAAAATKEAA